MALFSWTISFASEGHSSRPKTNAQDFLPHKKAASHQETSSQATMSTSLLCFKPLAARHLSCLSSTGSLVMIRSSSLTSSLTSRSSLSAMSGTFLPCLGSTNSLLTRPSSLNLLSSNTRLFQLATVASNNFELRRKVAQSNKSSSRLAKLVLVNQDGIPHPAQVFLYDFNANV